MALMAICALGYVCISSRKLDEWKQFAEEVLGLEVSAEKDGGLLLRLDDRPWRFRVEPGDLEDISAIGWECRSEQAFRDALGVLGQIAEEDPNLAEKRNVRGLARFTDPAGLVCELFWGPSEDGNRRLVSPVGVSGFVTGAQGLGHVVVATPDPVAYHEFYQKLGFSVSDYIDIEVGPNMVLPVTFMHCNPRHHTLAFAPAPSAKKCIHLMVQTASLDDVGFALDRAEAIGTPIASPLGRHTNDEMLSVYFRTPSGFDFEYGWGARTIDDEWRVVRHSRTSKWGHGHLGGEAAHA
jgi:biphenyl-2,3-diol 1,2-dioxygenase